MHPGKKRGRPRREPDATEDEAILRESIRVFAENGFEGTSIPHVVEAVGIPVGSLYRRFASKEALVNAAFRFAKRALGEAIRGPFEGDTPEDRFLVFWRCLAAFARREPVLFHFLELQDHLPYLDDESRAVELSVLAPLHEVVMELRAARVLRSDLSAPALMALVWGAFVGVFRAEKMGYFALQKGEYEALGRACFRAIEAPVTHFARSPEKTRRKHSSNDRSPA